MNDPVSYVVTGHGGILGRFDDLLPPRSVLVLEEPRIIAERGLPDRQPHRCVARLAGIATQAEASPEVLLEVARPPGVRAVIPANEYAVVAAAQLAEHWNLPGAGVRAARALRNKAWLREAASAGDIPQPAWHLVDDPEAAVRVRRGACVVKPTNRQASLGVTLIDADDDDDAVRDAWHWAIGAPETGIRTEHTAPPAVMLEERLRGREVSVEVLVSGGDVVFENVTDKVVQPGPYPVEAGHSLPADLGRKLRQRLTAVTRELVGALGFGDGILHGEWIVVDEQPYLVECAGRLPGDHIVDLIDLAYGGDLVADLVTVLEGRDPGRPQVATQGAAIRFVPQHHQGLLTAVEGVAEVAAEELVEQVEVTVQEGDRIGTPRSSWQRAGHVMVTAENAAAAAALAEEQVERIRIETT